MPSCRRAGFRFACLQGAGAVALLAIACAAVARRRYIAARASNEAAMLLESDIKARGRPPRPTLWLIPSQCCSRC